jgi:hypothetical protein
MSPVAPGTLLFRRLRNAVLVAAARRSQWAKSEAIADRFVDFFAV